MDTLHHADTDLEIHRLVVGPVDNNVFVLRCRATGEAVLIDAANEHDKLLALARRLGVRRVLETHGHWDHIQAIPEMRDAGYSVGVTAEDAADLPAYDEVIEHDTVIEVGRLRLRTIHKVPRGRLRDDHRVDRATAVRVPRCRHHRDARARHRHDHRRRAARPRRMGRPRLVTIVRATPPRLDPSPLARQSMLSGAHMHR